MVVMYSSMTERNEVHVSRRLKIVSMSQREKSNIKMSSGRSQMVVGWWSLGWLSLWEGAGCSEWRSNTVSNKWLLMTGDVFEVCIRVCISGRIEREEQEGGDGGSTVPRTVRR